ncbi:MAG: ATP-binding protein [Patescibacteria group bacterium]|nr:ATP-binding protein [Patescibacteria group bacterium]
MMLSVLAVYISILLGVLLFGGGLWLYFGNRTRPGNITMSALLICSGLWVFAHVLWRVSEGPTQQLFWLKTLVFISLMLPVLFLFYAVTYFRGRLPSLALQAAPLLPNMVAFWFIYGTDQVVQLGPGRSAVFGPGGMVLAMHFGIVYAVALLALFVVARTDRKEHRTAILTSFGGSVLAFNSVFAVLAGVSIFQDFHFFWLASVALTAGMLITAIPAIGRVILKDLRLLGAELFVLLSLTLIVTDIVVSLTLLDFTFRLVLLIIVMFYGVLVLRSHLREVHRLHQAELLNKRIAHLNRSLVKSDRMKTKFLSFASHQLRAPLTGVLSYLAMMHSGDFGKVNPKQKEVLALNEDAVRRLRGTIETFLDVSKIEMGGLELDRTETRMDQLCAEVAEELGPSATKKGIRIKMDVSGVIPPTMADSGKLYHAIVNLMDNAIKFTGRGRVVVSVKSGRGRVSVSVIDTGSGMDAKRLKKVRRVLTDGLEGIRFEREGGSGLGIHIARTIVEGHGGKLTVTSKGKGKGATFSFWIPKV